MCVRVWLCDCVLVCVHACGWVRAAGVRLRMCVEAAFRAGGRDVYMHADTGYELLPIMPARAHTHTHTHTHQTAKRRVYWPLRIVWIIKTRASAVSSSRSCLLTSLSPYTRRT